MWCSLPCRPWSTWQHIQYNPQLQSQREESLLLLSRFTEFMQRLFRYDSSVQCYFEWPRNADGWSLEQVQKLRGLLKYVSEFDGCAYDLKRSDNKLLLCKPWRIISTSLMMQQRLNRRCSKDHIHGECRGREAEQSGRYNNKLVNAFVDAMLRSS